MSENIKSLLQYALHKELLLDLEDRLKAEAVKAFEMVRDRAGLDKKRSRELEGQARFRMMEQGYEEVCTLHGGRLLEGGVIAATGLKIFQPYMRFEVEARGVILGLAAMPERKAIPIKNKSRLAGVALNYHLAPGFDFDGTGPKVGDVFGLLLVSRDKERAGSIDEIAVGIINSAYSSFLFYEPLDKFLSDQDEATTPTYPTFPVLNASSAPAIKLKKAPTPFVPPEAPNRADEHDQEAK